MLRLFQPGLVAAGAQAPVLVLTTFIAVLLAGYESIDPASSEDGSGHDFSSMSLFPFLRWADLLTAVGVALTSHRIIDVTAIRIGRASRLMRTVEPDHATKAILVQLCVTAIALAILALSEPPHWLIEAGRYFGCPSAASIIWPGTKSIGVASLGANAHAASKALDQR